MAKKYQFSVWKSTSPLWMLSHVLGGYFPNTQEKYLKILPSISTERCEYCSESLVYARPPWVIDNPKPSFIISDYTMIWPIVSLLGITDLCFMNLVWYQAFWLSCLNMTWFLILVYPWLWVWNPGPEPNHRTMFPSVPGKNNNLRICVQV